MIVPVLSDGLPALLLGAGGVLGRLLRISGCRPAAPGAFRVPAASLEVLGGGDAVRNRVEQARVPLGWRRAAGFRGCCH